MTNLLCAPHSLRGLFAALIFSFPQLQAEPVAVSPAERAPGANGNSEQITSPDQVPQGLAKSDWQSIRSAHKAWEHSFMPTKDGWQARNAGQQWTTQFDGRGFLAKPKGAEWQWGLELRSYGFGQQQRAVQGQPAVKAEGQRLSYQWDADVQEWFVNDQRGLEHGFTVARRPAGAAADAALDMVLGTRGTLKASVAADAQTIYFRDGAGAPVVTYAGLKVWDADGQVLPSRFVTGAEGGIILRVQEGSARYPITIDPIAQQAFLKPSAASLGTTGVEDQFGISVAVSGDTVVVGAYAEDSSTTGINSTPNEGASGAGAAYVFVRSAGTWSQQAYLKASQVTASDNFGYSVAVSGDTVVIGAFGEDGSTTGVNSTPDEGASGAGAAYVFVRSAGTWSQQAYLKASQVTASDQFGLSVAVSGDTVVVGAQSEDSSTPGINGTPNELASGAGAAYVFVRDGSSWSQQAYLKAAQVTGSDFFGCSVAVSGDTVVVGAIGEASSTPGINGTPNELAAFAGAAYVFTRSGMTWTQEAYLKASQVTDGDSFGGSVAVSGNTVVVGAVSEDSSTNGINSTPNESANRAGAAYVFVRSGITWSQQAYLKASQVSASDQFGFSVAVDGDTVIVGVPLEDSSTTGINSTPNEDASISGAAYVFVRSGITWSQQAYLKASQVSVNDQFGTSVAVSGDTVVVGANNEDSSTTGVNSTPNELASSSGAAYIFSGLGPVAPAPAVTNVAPATGSTAGGTAVIITGTNFTDASAVTFGGTNATSFTVNSATQITATTPAGTAGTASVLVTTPGGSNAANTLFNYVAPPTVTYVSPATGSTAGGTAVTITGTNFTGVSAVTIGGVAATGVDVINETLLNATTGAHAAGTADVVVTASGGTGTGIALYTYGSAPGIAGDAWTERTGAGTNNWHSIKYSADGRKLALAGLGKPIWTSEDGGVTWTERTASGSRNWYCVTSSSDGSKLAAVEYNGIIMTSADGGDTWVQRTTAGTRGWTNITSSTDGNKLAAVVYGGYIYTSADSGATWTERTAPGSSNWISIASSADGSKITAVSQNNFVYTSADSGATWTQRTSSGNRWFQANASSADGRKLVAVTYGGYIYTSADSGATWTERTGAGAGDWVGVTSSADGRQLAAVMAYDNVWTSNDSGATWTQRVSSGIRNWASITMPADGSRLAAVENGGYVYTSEPLLAPTVALVSPSSGSTLGGTAVTITGTGFTGTPTVTFGGVAATSVVVVDSTTITAVTPAGSAGAASVLVTTAGGTNAANTLFTYVAPTPVAALEAYLKASNTGTDDRFGSSVAVDGDTAVVGAPENPNAPADAGMAYVFTRSAGVWSQQAILVASNAEAGDSFGVTVAVDGDTIVVGALNEDSNARTVNGDGSNNNAANSGAAYVFTRTAGVWTQQAYLKANNADADDLFGYSVDVSGETIVVGAVSEDGNAATVNGNGLNNSLSGAGAAYVFTRSAGVWTQQAYLKPLNAGLVDNFGWSVAVDGDSVVVGAPRESSNATTVNGNGANDSATGAGAAYVFTRNAGAWSQQAYLKANNSGAADEFGRAVDVSGDTVVVGAFWESSNATTVNGDGSNNSLSRSGAAYVFTRSAGAWTQQAYLKANNSSGGDEFGRTVAVDGDVVVIGANNEDGSSTGINGASDDLVSNAGAAYVFVRSSGTWSQQSYLKASQVSPDDFFSRGVAVSGGTVVVGAYFEDSSSTGINSTPNEGATNAGAAYIFSGLGATIAAPTVTNVAPATGSTLGGTVVTITGTDFTNASAVTFGGTNATSFTVNSATQITATTPAGSAGTASVLVTTPGGTNAANTLFTYVAPPTVTSISPTSGSTLGGTAVTITGTNFTGASAVTIGGVAATSVSVVSDTSITAVTPAGSAGTASVLVTTPGGTNAGNSLYTYVVPNLAPTITSNGGGATASINVPENSTAVTTVTATDADLPAQTLTYTKSGADAAFFTLDSATGALSFTSPPNFEAPADSGLNNIYDVTVTVTDSGTPSLFDSQDLSIIVTNVNESPAIKPSSSYLAYETVNPTRNNSGLIVYTANNAATLAAQPFNRVRYRMENTTGGVAYFADASFDAWGGLTVAGLKVPDAGNILTTQRNVTNVSIRSNHPRVINSNTELGRLEHWTNNYATPGIIGGSDTLYDYDDTPQTPIVGYGSFQLHNLSATVPETVFAWNNHSLGAIPEVGFGNATIGIHPDWTFTNTGTNAWRMQIYIENNFVPPTMSFTEDVTGNILFFNSPFQDNDSASLTVTLAVADGTVTGNAGTGITVGGTAISRTFTGSVADLNAYFTTPGKVTYLGALNNTVSRTLTVTVSDGSLSTNTTSTLHLAPVNDVPTDIAVTPSNVPENYEPNTVVGTLSTTDPDVGDTFTYSLVAGTGAVDNASFSIVGNTLRITPSVDFETKPSYSIRVRTTEAGGVFFEKALTISVRDLLEQDIAYDDFRRPGDSGSGWSGNWSVANPAVANLVYPSLNSGGNAAGSGAGQRFRLLSSAQTTGVVYVSALLKGGGYCNLTLYDGSQEKVSFGVVYDPQRGTFNPNFGLFDETRKFEGAAAMVPSTVAVDTATHFILARVDLDLNTVDMWVDPNLSLPLGAPNCTSRAGSFGGSNYDFNRVRLEVTGAAVMDEVRIMAGDRRLVANRTTSASITSPTVANVKNTKATLGGDITQTGGSAILERGVVYAPTATNNNPEAGGTGVGQTMASGTSTGVFSVEVTGLLAGTNYSYKAYARNAIGTTYTLTTGTFTTLTLPEPIAADSGDVISNGLATGANGTSPVGSYGVLRRGGFLAENGVFAYPGYLLTGSGSPAVTVSDNSGIWKVQGGNPLLVARTGTTVPDVPGARFATLPEVPGLSEAGDVSMLSTLVIGSGGVTSANDSGLWSEIGGGGLRLLLREDDNVPSLAGVKVGAFASGVYATARTGASAGEAVFSVTFKGASTKTALLRTSVSGATTTVSVVAQEGEVAPGASPAANYVSVAGSYSDPGRMDAQGNFVYSALTTPGNKEGIWYQPVTGGTPNKVFFAGETAPGTGGATFARLQRPSMGSNGFISFRATLNRDGDNAANARNDGIWNGSAANPASFTCVLRRGDGVAKVSNLPVGSLVGNPWGGWLTNSNLGAWRAWLDVDGDGISSTADGDVNAIFANLSGAMQLAVKVGDAAPGTAAATFSGFDLPMVGGNNQYAILGNLTGGDTVTANNQGLWKSAPNGGALRLAIRKGETIVTTEGPKTVTKIDVPGSNQTDRRWEQPVMDSAGRMVVFVTFADGSTSQVIIP